MSVVQNTLDGPAAYRRGIFLVLSAGTCLSLGRIGDQNLSGQNARLAAQRETGIPVHLFEVFEKNKYIKA